MILEGEVSSNPVEDEVESKPKIKAENLIAIEKIVRDYANTVLRRNHVNPEHVEIHLSQDINAIFSVFGGHTVKLFLRWPEVQPVINQTLRDFCILYKRQNLRRTMEVIPYAISYMGIKQLIKEKFTSENDIILDLLSKGRIKVQKTETITYTDTLTGQKVSVTTEGKSSRFDGSDVGVWVQLSRMARDNEIKENE